VSIRQIKIPGRQERSKDEAFFYTITTAQERHVIQSAAPTPFQVVNDQEEDGAWSRPDAATLARWCAARREGWPRNASTKKGWPAAKQAPRPWPRVRLNMTARLPIIKQA